VLVEMSSEEAASAVVIIVPSPLAGEGYSMLPRAMMGEGCLLATNPSPIRVRGRTIVPSPARGEGTKGGTVEFAQTKPSGESASWVRAKHLPAAVQNDRWRNFIVSGLFFTGNGATAACLALQRPSRIQVAARLPTRSKSPINPPNTGSTPMPRTTLASRVRSPSQSSPWKVSLERTATMRGR
jgi:hypothetical protein